MNSLYFDIFNNLIQHGDVELSVNINGDRRLLTINLVDIDNSTSVKTHQGIKYFKSSREAVKHVIEEYSDISVIC